MRRSTQPDIGRAASGGVALVLALLAVTALSAGDKKAKKDDPLPPEIRWNGVSVRDEAAFFGRNTGLVVMNFKDPLRPFEVGSLMLRPEIYGIDLMAGMALLAGGSAGLLIVDLEDPEGPELAQSYDPPEMVRGVVGRDPLAYLIQRRGGLRVVDLSTPVRPRELLTISTRGELRSVAFQGDWMAIAEGSGGVRLFDNTRPRAPRDRFHVRPRNWASALDVALIDDRLLIAAGRGGLLVYRWGTNEQPTYIGAFVADRAIDTVTPFGKLAIVSHGSTGMSIVDPMHADGPLWVSTIDLPRGFPVSDVTVAGDLAYIVSGRAGFGVVDLSEPTRPDVILPRKRPLRVTFPQSGLIED